MKQKRLQVPIYTMIIVINFVLVACLLFIQQLSGNTDCVRLPKNTTKCKRKSMWYKKVGEWGGGNLYFIA